MRASCVGLVLLASGIIAAALIGGAMLVRNGISARSEPSSFEARVAHRLRAWAIPAEARDATNPIPPGPRVVAEGLAHFADHCATCHANDGSGQTAIGRSLYPRAPDMRGPATQSLTDGELFYIIENGVRLTGMPAWGQPGSAEGTWHLVQFIRHLPRLSAAEKARMEALNPKSPDEWREMEEENSFLRGEEPPPRQSLHGVHSH